MRDTIKGKAARYQMAHEPDCGTCHNCLEVAAYKRDYESLLVRRVYESVPKEDIIKARHAWLETSRLKRCTYNELKDLAQKVGRSDRQKEV